MQFRVNSFTLFLKATARVCFLVVVLAGSGALGRQWLVGGVHITGNHVFSKSRLLGGMETKPTHFWRTSVYSSSKVTSDLDAIKTLYNQQGYLDAKADAKTVHDTSASRVKITVDISEGLQTMVEGVNIRGKTTLVGDSIRNFITTKPGAPLSRWTLGKDVQTITDTLGFRGFLYARVVDSVIIDSSRHHGIVSFLIDQGPLIFAGPISHSGLREVRPQVAMRELRFKPGDTLTLKAIRRSALRLYTTGLFNYAQVGPVSERLTPIERQLDTLYEPVLVSLAEARFLSIDGAIGYGSFEHFRTSIIARYGNLWGLGQAITFNGSYNRLEQRAAVTYSFPWIFSLRLHADISPFIEHHNVNYLGLFDGVLFSVGQEFDWNLSYRLWANVERVEYVRAVDTTAAPSRTNTQSIGADLLYDSRIGRADTAWGVFVQVSPELAGLGGRGTNQYYRALIDVRGYLNPFKWLSLSSAINAGFAHGYGANGASVPPQALYYLGVGSMRQVRGYPIDAVNGSGRLAIVINLLEAQMPVYKWFGVTVFGDAGFAWSDPQAAALKDLRWVIGPGIFIKSPIGTVQLDLGYRLKVQPGWGTLYFTVGRAF
jgi:outer membrane protein insertion porin family